MSSRFTSAGRSSAGKSDSQTLERRTRSSTPSRQAKDSPSKGVAVFKTRPGTTIEVTVKTKDHIGPSTMPTSRASNEKKETTSSSKTNWNQILSDQTRTSIKGAMQQQTQSSRTTSRFSSTEEKKITDKRQPSKYNPRIDKLIDTIPQKLPASSQQKKNHDNNGTIKNYSSITAMDNSQPITVFDKGIQCGGIFDCSSGSLSLFNPVRTLGFLMKELERYVYDEKASKILTEMEQALMRIPTEPGKISPEDLEVISMRNNLEAVTTKLAAKSKQMESMYETIIKEKEQLKQKNREQKYLLDQAVQRENELELLIRRLRADLNNANTVLKTEQANRKKIFELEEDVKKMEMIQKDLKNDLNEQMEIAQQAFFEAQYLKLEKEKLTALANFKDTQLVDHRKSIKNLQNLIHNQLINLSKESSLNEKFDKSECSTVIRGGKASSSHISSSNSIAPMTCFDESLLSISSVASKDENNHTKIPIKSIPLKDESVQTLDDMLNESGSEKFKEKTHLEFTSLAGEEISRSMSGFNRNHDDTIYKNLDEVDHHTSNKRRTIHSINDTIKNNQANVEVKKTKLKTRRSMNDKKSPKRMNFKNSDDEKILKSNFDEKKALKEVKIMFENARMKNQFNVKIPSPPRHYPDPNWTDSSLPTMSVTESNVV